MLIVTRRIQDSIVFEDNRDLYGGLRVKVLAIQGNRVKLGFSIDGKVVGEHWQVRRGIREGANAKTFTDKLVNHASIGLAT